MSTIHIEARVGRQAITASILKTVITINPRASSNPPRTTPLTSTRRNTPIDPATVTCYNCGKDGYFASSCLELKDIGNIEEMEEEDTSNESGKDEP